MLLQRKPWQVVVFARLVWYCCGQWEAKELKNGTAWKSLFGSKFSYQGAPWWSGIFWIGPTEQYPIDSIEWHRATTFAHLPLEVYHGVMDFLEVVSNLLVIYKRWTGSWDHQKVINIPLSLPYLTWPSLAYLHKPSDSQHQPSFHLNNTVLSLTAWWEWNREEWILWRCPGLHFSIAIVKTPLRLCPE